MPGYWKRTKRVSGEIQTRTPWWCVPGVWLIVHCNRGRRKCSEHAQIPNQLPLFSPTFLAWGWGLRIPEVGRLLGVLVEQRGTGTNLFSVEKTGGFVVVRCAVGC